MRPAVVSVKTPKPVKIFSNNVPKDILIDVAGALDICWNE